MARLRQTARFSTGGKAPRSNHYGRGVTARRSCPATGGPSSTFSDSDSDSDSENESNEARQRSFNNPDFADVRVVFRTTQGDGFEEEPEPELDGNELSFFAHKVILAEKSSVFRALLQREKEKQKERSGQKRARKEQQQQQPGSEADLEVLVLPVEEGEQVAAEVLLRCLYSFNLRSKLEEMLDEGESDSSAPAKALVLAQLYRMLDRFEIDSKKCSSMIKRLDTDDVRTVRDVNAICNVLSSAPALQSSDAMGHLCKISRDWMCESLETPIPVTIKSLLLRLNPDGKGFKDGDASSDFLGLNFHAVKLLLGKGAQDEDEGSDLQAESENDVVVLLSLWIYHQEHSLGQPCTEAQLTALTSLIRLAHLSPSYLEQLTDIAPWCKVDPKTLMYARLYKCLESDSTSDPLVDEGDSNLDLLSECRDVPDRAYRSATVICTYSVDVLREWCDKLETVDLHDVSSLPASQSELTYFNGFVIDVYMRARVAAGEDGIKRVKVQSGVLLSIPITRQTVACGVYFKDISSLSGDEVNKSSISYGSVIARDGDAVAAQLNSEISIEDLKKILCRREALEICYRIAEIY